MQNVGFQRALYKCYPHWYAMAVLSIPLKAASPRERYAIAVNVSDRKPHGTQLGELMLIV